jgi:hypothetical protein
MVGHAVVDLRDQRGDGRVQFPKREEPLVESFATINRIATSTATLTLALVPRLMRPLADAARGETPTRVAADVPFLATVTIKPILDGRRTWIFQNSALRSETSHFPQDLTH